MELFYYIYNQLLVGQIRKTVTLTIISKRMKYPMSNITKQVKLLYPEKIQNILYAVNIQENENLRLNY